MPRIELSDGTTVLLFSPSEEGDFSQQGVTSDVVTVKLSQVAQQAGKVLLQAAESVRHALKQAAPSEFEIEIGMTVGKEGSIIIASAKAEGSIKIKGVWK